MRFDVRLKDQSKASAVMTLDGGATAECTVFDISASNEDRAYEVLAEYLDDHATGDYGSDVDDYELTPNPRDKDQLGYPFPEGIRACS